MPEQPPKSSPPNDRLDAVLQRLDRLVEGVEELVDIQRSHTSDGRPLASLTPDKLSLAYLLIAGQGLARAIAADERSVSDILKGSACLAEQLVTEIDSFQATARPQGQLQRLLDSLEGA